MAEPVIAGAEGFARIGDSGSERPVYVTGGKICELGHLTDDINPAFIGSGEFSAVGHAARSGKLPRQAVPPGVRFGPPVVGTRSLVCVGLNYHDHARETGQAAPAEPILFFKATNTIVGPTDPIHIPPGSTKTDWEIELALVIGERAWCLDDEHQASAAIAGYSISNDVSERAYQLERGGQWVKGKSCPTFNPLGPVLAPADILAPSELPLVLSVNGRVKQSSSSAEMIFSPTFLVWYISQFLALEPGDIINTGTPHGVGLGQSPEAYLKVGDEIQLAIPGLGAHRTRATQ